MMTHETSDQRTNDDPEGLRRIESLNSATEMAHYLMMDHGFTEDHAWRVVLTGLRLAAAEA